MHISDNIEVTKTDNERCYMTKKVISLFLIAGSVCAGYRGKEQKNE